MRIAWALVDLIKQRDYLAHAKWLHEHNVPDAEEQVAKMMRAGHHDWPGGGRRMPERTKKDGIGEK